MPQFIDRDAVVHEIRNAIVNYRGLRKHMFQNIISIVKDISEIDKQIIRVEKALGGDKPIERRKTWLERLKNPFNVFK